MVHNYKRKTNDPLYTEKTLQKAIEDVRNGTCRQWDSNPRPSACVIYLFLKIPKVLIAVFNIPLGFETTQIRTKTVAIYSKKISSLDILLYSIYLII